jgi:hypothetical protein
LLNPFLAGDVDSHVVAAGGRIFAANNENTQQKSRAINALQVCIFNFTLYFRCARKQTALIVIDILINI